MNKKDKTDTDAKYTINVQGSKSNLIKQMERGEEILNEAKSVDPKHIYLRLTKYNVHEYARRYTLKGLEKGLCIILDNSYEHNSMVLICPIYKINSHFEYKDGLRINAIPGFDYENEYLAAIQEIRYVKKNRFLLNEIIPSPVGYVMKSILDEIIYLYISLLKRIVQMPIVHTDIRRC